MAEAFPSGDNQRNSSRSDANHTSAESTTSPTPESHLSLTNYLDLLSLYECPVCLNHISPPIMQCTNAHLLCKPCLTKLPEPRKCPTCRELLPFKLMRCLPMEKMAEISGLKFPCRFAINGCQAKNPLKEKQDHENSCEYRSYVCEEVYADGLYKNCRWVGPHEQLVQHMIDYHKLPLNQLVSRLNISYANMDMNLMDSRWEGIISYHGHHFLLVLGKVNDQFNAILAFVGEQRVADQFRYTLELKIGAQRGRLWFEGTPQSIRLSVPDLLFDIHGLQFNSAVAYECLDREDFKITVTINKVHQ